MRKRPPFKAFCQRSGFKINHRDLIKEPGTGFLVHRKYSDGKWNLVDHPRNFAPSTNSQEGVPLEPTSPEPDDTSFAYRFLGVEIDGIMYRISLDKRYLLRVPNGN